MAGGPLGGRTELLGAVHVHTHHSDGTGSVAEVAAAAGECGLDFVVISDHDTLDGRADGGQGWHGRVLAAVGAEVATRKNWHLLALGPSEVPERHKLDAAGALDFLDRAGARTLAAHPHGRGLSGRKRDMRDWPFWSHPRLAGCEVWSYLQDWAAGFRFWRRRDYLLKNVASKIQGPPDWLLARWDAEAERRPFAGLGALDNHAKRPPFSRQLFFPHPEMLGRMTNRVRLSRPLPADGDAAAGELSAALAAGRCTFAREELAPSQGFDFRATAADGRVLRSGDSAPVGTGAQLVVESPVEAELRICRRGEVIASTDGKKLEHAVTEPGAYRAEARLENKAWCFSNHVRLLEKIG